MISLATRLISRYSHINWAIMDQTMVSGVNFATGVLLARFLGIEEFGRFTLAWMAILFVNSIQLHAVVSPLMSIGPKQTPEEQSTYYGAVAAQQAIFGILSFFLIWGVASFVATLFPEWNMKRLALPIACAAPAFQIQDFLRRYFFVRGRPARAFANDMVRYLGQLAVLVWLYQFAEMDTVRVLWVVTALALLAALMFGANCLVDLTWDTQAFIGTVRRHWVFSKWLIGSSLMLWSSSHLFILAVGAIMGAGAVGALRAAQNLMGVTNILLQGMENIVPAGASTQYHREGGKGLLRYIVKVVVLGEMAIGVVAVAAAVMPAFWLGLVFGDEYREYGYLLQWFAVIYLLMYLTLTLEAALRAIERTKAVFWGYLIMTAFSLAAVYPLINYLGLVGATIGLFSAQAILFVFLGRSFFKAITDGRHR